MCSERGGVIEMLSVVCRRMIRRGFGRNVQNAMILCRRLGRAPFVHVESVWRKEWFGAELAWPWKCLTGVKLTANCMRQVMWFYVFRSFELALLIFISELSVFKSLFYYIVGVLFEWKSLLYSCIVFGSYMDMCCVCMCIYTHTTEPLATVNRVYLMLSVEKFKIFSAKHCKNIN